MDIATNRLEFAPPVTPGFLRSLALALLAHAFLLAVLTLGVQWKSEPLVVSAEAELWSALPQEAAPRLIEPAPEPPAPVPLPPAPMKIDTPTPPDPSIALERDRQRLQKERELKQRQEVEKHRLQQQQEELQREKKRLQDKREQDRKLAQEKKKLEEEAQRADAARQTALQRQANLKRMAGLAGASGTATAQGSTLRSSGPSASYAGRIRARIKPNIVFVDDVTGNPKAEVEVRTAPDGTIVSRKLTQSSGLGAWDDAVLRAIDKTETLPRDVDGRVISPLVISFTPKD